MKTYLVSLVRSYGVIIKAKNKEKALRYAEFYIGDCHDLSTQNDREKDRFSIIEIEPTMNETLDVEEVEELEK